MKIPLPTQIRSIGLPDPVPEYRFHPERRFRWDWCWPDHLLAVEVQGGIWTGGRHVRGKGYHLDCLKLCEGVLLGWRVLWVVTAHVEDGTAIKLIERAFHGTNK